MTLKEEVEQDIKNFYKQIESQDFNDKIGTLRVLLNKYAHLSTVDFLMDKNDFDSIISNARGLFVRKSMPTRLVKSGIIDVKLEPSEEKNLCLIESAVAFFNKNECLNKLPRFKYKDNN